MLLEVNVLPDEWAEPSRWPGPEGSSGDHSNVRQFPAAISLPPKRRRLWWFIALLVATTIASVVSYHLGGKNAVNDYQAQVKASAAAEAAKLPPADLFCPDANSEDARKAIRDLPVVVIDRPPIEHVLIMRKAVVVVVKADLAGDLVVCGNDARLVLEKTPRPSARILMQGGTDTKAKGAGPMVFAVDAATVRSDRVWFSNHNPQILPCRGSGKLPANREVRPCTSYYSTVPPPSAVPTPSRSR